MVYEVTNIKWDTDGARVKLPKNAIVEAEDEDEIADILSDEYGFCIYSLEIKEK